MRFVVSTTLLQQKLQRIQGVVSTNTVLPILEDFHFDIQQGTLTVRATDLETSIRTSLKVEASENGSVAIPAKILLDTLKTLPEQPITISFDEETFGVEIHSENGKYKLAGENPEEFPALPVLEDPFSMDVPSDSLIRGIHHTLFAASNDELRPAMTGVFFQCDMDGLIMVSTDASKLVKYKNTNVSSNQTTSFIVPKKALSLLKGSLPAESVSVKVEQTANNVFFHFGDTSLMCRLVDAKFPDYNAVIPVQNDNRLSLDRITFQNMLKRVSLFSNRTTFQVVLNVQAGQLKVSTQDLDFANEAYESVPAEFEGSDLEIGFNARFLIEMLGVLEGKEVELKLSSPSSAGLLFPKNQESGEEITMLVMPVMIS